jgi:heptosyltransferase-2
LINKKSEKKAKKILVIDFGGVGDLVLAIPFLRGLKRVFTFSEVSVLCAERRGAILKKQLYIKRLFFSPITPPGLLKTGLQLRKKRFDMAINLMPETSYFTALKMYLLFLLINARQWVGRDAEGRGFFYDIKVSEPKMQMENEILMYGRILKAISNEDLDEGLEFHIARESKRRAEELLSEERNFKKALLVLINPGSDWPSKRWPMKRYAEVVKILKDLFPNIEFGVIGTKGDLNAAHIIKEEARDRVFVLSGKTSLEILPAVLGMASLLITNDSGPAHIARAVGTPVVVLAGPSEPAYVTVQGRNESVVIQHLIPCAPCVKKFCKTMDCWQAISVHEVVDVASRMLKRRINEAHK